MYHSDEVSRNGLSLLHGMKKGVGSYLLQTPALGANKGNTVAVVDVGGDGSHAVPRLGVECVTGYQLGTTEGLVDVQAAERVVNGYRLQKNRRCDSKV